MAMYRHKHFWDSTYPASPVLISYAIHQASSSQFKWRDIRLTDHSLAHMSARTIVNKIRQSEKIIMLACIYGMNNSCRGIDVCTKEKI